MQGYWPPKRKLYKAKSSAGHGGEEGCSQHKHAMIKFAKLKTPLSKDQGRGAVNSGPEKITDMSNVLRSISSHEILAQDKIDIMQQAVARCPKVSISSKGVQIPSLLNAGSEVSLICHSYFKENYCQELRLLWVRNLMPPFYSNSQWPMMGSYPLKHMLNWILISCG